MLDALETERHRQGGACEISDVEARIDRAIRHTGPRSSRPRPPPPSAPKASWPAEDFRVLPEPPGHPALACGTALRANPAAPKID